MYPPTISCCYRIRAYLLPTRQGNGRSIKVVIGDPAVDFDFYAMLQCMPMQNGVKLSSMNNDARRIEFLSHAPAIW
jgi:hypothetical protein